MHLHVSLHPTVHAVYGPAEAAQQDDDQHDDDQRRKSPAQQEVEQVPALRVLVVHHQHLPEVHGLRTQTGRSRLRLSQLNRLNIGSEFGDVAARGPAGK